MNNPKSAFSSKYIADHRLRSGLGSVFTTWPNLFPAYTISYSAATGKPIESNKKKLSVLLALLLLLITSLAASLILAFLWFNAIQSEYTNESSLKISSNQVSPDHHHHHHHHHHQINHHKLNGQKSTTRSTPSLKSTTTTTPTSTTSTSTTTTSSTTPSSVETESASSTSEDEDGFGEKESDNNAPNQNSPSNNDQTNNSNDEHLINYYKNMRNELDRNNNRPTNKIRDEEKLDGDWVEHHTISDIPDDAPGELSSFLQPEQPVTLSSNHNSNQNEPNLMSTEDYNARLQSEQNLNLPEQLISLRAKQFCNLNSYVSVYRNSSYECRSVNNLNPGLISSYFCNDKFVIVAKINSLKESSINEQADQSEKQLISKYDVHIERILKRSPFLSVAFKKQGLTTNVTINLEILANELRHSEGNAITCFGQRLELKLGQTYLLSGHIFGLSAVSGNCDLQLEWFNDLDEEQRNKLITWSTSRTSFSHC